MATLPSRTITVSIDRPPAEVYAFVSNPANFSKFAAFVDAVEQRDGQWILETSAGSMPVRFVAKNDLGVLDHTVTMPSGLQVVNAMRVIANGGGSEVLFTLIHRPDMSEEQFAADGRAVETDLRTLKSLLE